jgi:hypothetical protein
LPSTKVKKDFQIRGLTAVDLEIGVEPFPDGRRVGPAKVAFSMVGWQTLLQKTSQSEDLPMAVEPEEGVEPSPGGRVSPVAVAEVPLAHSVGGVAALGRQDYRQQGVLDAHLGEGRQGNKMA